jgi:hypothetical protein
MCTLQTKYAIFRYHAIHRKRQEAGTPEPAPRVHITSEQKFTWTNPSLLLFYLYRSMAPECLHARKASRGERLS